MVARLLQFSNAAPPILVTLGGIVILVRLLHPENTPLSMLVTFESIVMVDRLLQFWNA